MASLPTGAVTLVIGSLNFGSRIENKIMFYREMRLYNKIRIQQNSFIFTGSIQIKIFKDSLVGIYALIFILETLIVYRKIHIHF